MARENYIERWGVLESVDEDSCTVCVLQSSACQTCAASGLCQSAEGKLRLIRTVRPSHVPTVGSRVLVRAAARQGLHAAWLAYALPLFLSVAALFMAVHQWGEAVGALLALLVLAAYYMVLYAMRARIGKRMEFHIIRAAEEGEKVNYEQ